MKPIFKHLHMCLDLRLQRPHSPHAPHRVVPRLAHLRQVQRVQQVELGQDLAIEHVGQLREDGVEDGDTTASQSSHDLRLARSPSSSEVPSRARREWLPDAKLTTSNPTFGEKTAEFSLPPPRCSDLTWMNFLRDPPRFFCRPRLELHSLGKINSRNVESNDAESAISPAQTETRSRRDTTLEGGILRERTVGLTIESSAIAPVVDRISLK